MGSVTKLIFPGMLLGSLIITLFGFSVMSGISLPAAVEASVTNPAAAKKGEPATDVAAPSSSQENPAEQSSGAPACNISEKFPEKIRQWCELISLYAKQHNLEADLIAALIWQESGGNSLAYSHSGAVGLMQVMPRDGIAASFMCKNGPCFTNRPTIAELQDPELNISYGISMLAGLANKYGNLRDALKYYGPKDVGYYYADKVLSIYQNYRK